MGVILPIVSLLDIRCVDDNSFGDNIAGLIDIRFIDICLVAPTLQRVHAEARSHLNTLARLVSPINDQPHLQNALALLSGELPSRPTMSPTRSTRLASWPL